MKLLKFYVQYCHYIYLKKTNKLLGYQIITKILDFISNHQDNNFFQIEYLDYVVYLLIFCCNYHMKV